MHILVKAWRRSITKTKTKRARSHHVVDCYAARTWLQNLTVAGFVQEKALEKAFAKFGRVEHVRVLRDKGSAYPASVC